MPTIKLTVSDEELAFLRLWANGSAVATLAKHAVLLKARLDLGTHAVPSNGTASTRQVPTEGTAGPSLEPGTHVVPTEGTAVNPANRGTSLALSPEKKKKKKRRNKRGDARGGQAELVGTAPPPVSEPFVREVVGHLNDVCGTAFPPHDKKVREYIAQLMADGYTIDDMKAVNEWAARTIRDEVDHNGTNWFEKLVKPSYLYGPRFGEHLGMAKKKAPKPDDGGFEIPPEEIIGTPEFNARMRGEKVKK
jgi:uncharacterized phage protein (TIGR02220 family)